MKALKLNALKKHREAKQWTQDMLADFSGVSVRTIQRLESGSGASMDTAKSLAATLGLQSVAELQEIQGAIQPEVADSAPVAAVSPAPEPSPAIDPSHAQNHEFVSMLRKQHMFGGAVLFIMLIIAVLSSPEGRNAVYWTIGSGLTAAAVGWLLMRRLPKERILPSIAPFAALGFMIALMWQGYQFLHRGFQEIQLKAFVVQVYDARSSVDHALGLWMDEQEKAGEDVFHYGKLRVDGLLKDGSWAELVSKMSDRPFPASCPPLRVDMTTDELNDWLDHADQVCVKLSSRGSVRMYGGI